MTSSSASKTGGECSKSARLDDPPAVAALSEKWAFAEFWMVEGSSAREEEEVVVVVVVLGMDACLLSDMERLRRRTM